MKRRMGPRGPLKTIIDGLRKTGDAPGHKPTIVVVVVVVVVVGGS